MMKKIVLTIIPILMLVSHSWGQGNNNTDIVEVAKYKGDKSCAISYTFDDGLSEQYKLVIPRLEKLNLKCTFFINGSKINKDDENITDTTRMTWTQLKEMADKGQEVSNHGWAHKNFGRHTLDEIREDIFKNDSAIFFNVGIMPRTFCYPNNNKQADGKAIAVQNRVGTRTFQKAIGGKSTTSDLEKWVNSLIETNDWGVGMTHGITYGYDAFKDPEVFWEHLEKVKEKEDSIWVATFHDVSAYITERDSIILHTKGKTKKGYTILPELLLDKSLYSVDLSMVIRTDKPKRINAYQKGKALEIKRYTDKVVFDFDPYGGLIEIKYTARDN